MEEAKRIKIYTNDKNVILTLRIISAATFMTALILIESFLINYPAVMFIVIAIISALSCFIFFYYIKRYFDIYRIEITEKYVKQVRGFFFIKESVMPLDAIQYSTVILSTFLTSIGMRGLNIVILYAYGGSMIIPFLSEGDSAKLKHMIDKHIETGDISSLLKENYNKSINKEDINIDIDIDIYTESGGKDV